MFVVGMTGLTALAGLTGQAAGPVPGQPAVVDLGNEQKLDMVWIPEGEFTMGSTSKEREWAVPGWSADHED